MPIENSRRSGSFAKIVVAFVIVAVAMLAYQVAGLVSVMDYTLGEALKQTQELYCVHLGSLVGDEVAAGKDTEIDSILSHCLSSDTDLSFAIVVSPDGKVLGSTDKNLKNMVLNTNSVDKAALAADRLTRLETDYKHGLSQVAMPLVKNEKKIGVLRIGFSSAAARSAMQRTTQTSLVAAFLLLVISTAAFSIMVMRILDALLDEHAVKK